MGKERYIDLMDVVFSAYTDEKISEYTQSVIEDDIKEHGYPRLTANLGILIAHGRRKHYKDRFKTMMDLCCSQIPYAFLKNGNVVGNDFSVKEIVLCLLEIEKAGLFPEEVTKKWREDLAKIVPDKTYTVIVKDPKARVGNWAAFGAASEQARIYAGIGSEKEFISKQIANQLLVFDENGMYKDPDEPMVYDLATRLQLALALYLGLEGEQKEALEEQLRKSAELTIKMQSVSGEIPYGGRSSQFLHNEAFYAALFEFYAGFFKKSGDFEKAKEFKSCARRAVEAILPWLEEEKISHIKNYFPIESKFGCEGYAYFDKYMITTASWLYVAYLMADDSIPEGESTECKYVCETGKSFHKVMCRYNDYFAEIDTKADIHYDASGIGRIHKRGAPSAICISVPVSKNPNYSIDIKNPSELSICGGIMTDSGYEYTSDADTNYTLSEKTVTDEFVSVAFECETKSGRRLEKRCTLSEEGVKIEVAGDGEVEILFPVFFYDGASNTNILIKDNCVKIEYKGHTCTYTTDGEIIDRDLLFANRNGHYKGIAAKGNKVVSVIIKID